VVLTYPCLRMYARHACALQVSSACTHPPTHAPKTARCIHPPTHTPQTKSCTKHLERAYFFGIRVLQSKPSCHHTLHIMVAWCVQNCTHSLIERCWNPERARVHIQTEIPIIHSQTWLEHEPFPSAQTPSCSSLGPCASSPALCTAKVPVFGSRTRA